MALSFNHSQHLGLILSIQIILLNSFGISNTWALGDAGQTISNRATVTYQVDSNAQDPIESSPTGNTTIGLGNGADTTFIEDRLLNFTLTRIDSSEVNVAPGQNGVATSASAPVLEFEVTNSGNGCQDLDLSALQESGTSADVFGAGSITDNFNISAFSIFVDSTLGGGQTFDGSGTDSATFVDELCPGETATVYVVATGTPAIAAIQENGDLSLITLTAQIAIGATTSADGSKNTGVQGANITTDDSGSVDIPGTEQNVMAINLTPAGNAVADLAGSPSAGALQVASAFEILAAELISTKLSILSIAATTQSGSPTIGDDLSDTVTVALGGLDEATLTHGTAKRIPGAQLDFVLEVQNEDSAIGNNNDATTAENVVLSDDLSALVSGGSASFLTPAAGPTNITATLITDNGGSETTTTTMTFVGSDPTADFYTPTHPVGSIVYDTSTHIIYGLCGDLRGNDNPTDNTAGANLDEACRLVFNLTVD